MSARSEPTRSSLILNIACRDSLVTAEMADAPAPWSSIQLAALTKLLDDYSTELGIEGDISARDHLAARIMSLFNDGITNPEDIKRNLDSSSNRWLIERAAP